jgi:hypothetical protein
MAEVWRPTDALGSGAVFWAGRWSTQTRCGLWLLFVNVAPVPGAQYQHGQRAVPEFADDAGRCRLAIQHDFFDSSPMASPSFTVEACVQQARHTARRLIGENVRVGGVAVRSALDPASHSIRASRLICKVMLSRASRARWFYG